jgi:hypothetical protein
MPLAPLSLATAAPVAREANLLANANWRANVEALTVTQPELSDRLAPLADVTWCFGRDGALTAHDAAGAWWAGCSVPAAAAKAMLKSFGGSGTVACFLRPPSAAALRVALDRLRANQAIVAIVPDAGSAWVILHCENFAAAVCDHRLWLAIGDEWEQRLATLLVDNGGLPIPSQFVRLSDGTEELAEAMITPAQRIFSEATQRRAGAIGQLLESAAPATSQRVCVLAPSHFRLWDDAGYTLARFATHAGWTHVDPDDPACASPLAMTRAASQCGAIVTPNTGRADLPNVVALSTPWITWATGPRVPAFFGAGARDALIVADPAWRDTAVANGWPAERVHVATWPVAELPPATQGPLLILADVRPLDPPKEVVEMSSHRLLWDAIADELTREPFALGSSILDYLQARMRRINIGANAIDQRRFIDDLIVPAYARGLADLLRQNGLPLRCAGEGWATIEMLKPLATGPVTTRESFREAIAASAALVHVLPTACGHPIAQQGRPVVYATHGREAFLRDARAAAAGRLAIQPSPTPQLTADFLRRLLEMR